MIVARQQQACSSRSRCGRCAAGVALAADEVMQAMVLQYLPTVQHVVGQSSSAPVKVVRIVLYIMHDARTAPIAHSRVSAHLSPVLRSHDTEPHHGATLTHNVHSTGTVGECDERPRRHCRLAQRSLTVRSKPHQTRPRACCCATTALHTSCLSAFARCLLLTLRTLQRVKATVRCVHRGRPGSP